MLRRDWGVLGLEQNGASHVSPDMNTGNAGCHPHTGSDFVRIVNLG